MKKLVLIFIPFLLVFLSCEQSIDTGTDNTLNFSDYNADPSRTGRGGSFARFAIKGDRLYTVDQNKLRVFNISDVTNPTFINKHNVGNNVETIFPYKENLFIGTSWGMYIYSISNPDQPRELSFYRHIFGCDPVVANDEYAFVSIRTGAEACQMGSNRVDIVDIRDLTNPIRINTMFRTQPKGVGLQFNEFYLCDNGIWKFDISNIDDIESTGEKIGQIDAYDVIPFGDYLGVIGNDGFYQYKNENGQLVEISKITIDRQ